MTALKDRIKHALDEGRTLILGVEVLIGFDFRSGFEPTLENLPLITQYTQVAGLALMLVALALLIAPTTRHRIVERGADSEMFLTFTTRSIEIGLLPFAVALGLDLYLAAVKITGPRSAWLVGGLTTAVALLFWYGWEAISRHRRRQEKKTMSDNKNSGMKLSSGDGATLDEKIEHVLTELRMVLPGVQALLGFQLTIILMESFDQLPLWSKYIHMVSLALIAISVILLMTPAAYHRIVERGEDTEVFHRFASRALLAAVVPLALGVSGDFFVVVQRITHVVAFAIIASVIMLAIFYGLWFALPMCRRVKEIDLPPPY